MNQPGRARPGSVEYESRSDDAGLSRVDVRSYSSSTNGSSFA